MEHINNALNMLKHITEEKLIDCVHQNGQLVLLNR